MASRATVGAHPAGCNDEAADYRIYQQRARGLRASLLSTLDVSMAEKHGPIETMISNPTGGFYYF
jgi:hypothetical protein